MLKLKTKSIGGDLLEIQVINFVSSRLYLEDGKGYKFDENTLIYKVQEDFEDPKSEELININQLICEFQLGD